MSIFTTQRAVSLEWKKQGRIEMDRIAKEIPIYVKEDLSIFYRFPEVIENDGVLSIKSGTFIIKVDTSEEEIEIEDMLYIIHVLKYMIRTNFEQTYSTQLLALGAEIKKEKNGNTAYV